MRPWFPLLLWGLLLLVGQGFAQDTTAVPTVTPDATATVDAETAAIYRFEQAFGRNGLYLTEPTTTPGGQLLGVLLRLTLAARLYQLEHPGRTPTVEALAQAGLIKEAPPELPEGMEYVWEKRTRRFRTSEKGPDPLAMSALGQLSEAEDYRRSVFYPGPEVQERLQVLFDDPATPARLKQEIEARLYLLRMAHSREIHDAETVQERLRELHEAIETAVAMEKLRPDQRISLRDVGMTGLIDRLRALPNQGVYVVTRSSQPPAARYGTEVIPLDPDYPRKVVQRRLADQTLAAVPDYPPALAAKAQSATDGAEALALINRAIELAPDVAAFRNQRLAIASQLGRVDTLEEDLRKILEVLPAAPVLLELDAATRHSVFRQDQNFRAKLALMLARVRPDLLNLQLLALWELAENGQLKEAETVRQNLLARHPGYEPFLPPPEELLPDPTAAPSTPNQDE